MSTLEQNIGNIEDQATAVLNIKDYSLLKSGALGALTYQLAYLQSDALSYYNKLYSEMNAAFAQDLESLFFHSTFYGYTPVFANPSVLTGKLMLLDLGFEGKKNVTIKIPVNTEFVDSLGLPYTFESDYEISVNNIDGVLDTSCIVKGADNTVQYLGAQIIPNPNIIGSNFYLFDLIDVKQYKSQIFNQVIPNYNFGSFYDIPLPVDRDEFIYELECWIKINKSEDEYITQDLVRIYPEDYDLTGYELFPSSVYKYLSTGTDKNVFLTIKDNNEYILSLGSGRNGYYIPAGSDVVIKIKTTKGAAGNIGSSEFVIQDIKQNIVFNNDKLAELYTEIPGVSIDGAFAGNNFEDKESIRRGTLASLRSRDNLVSHIDYQDLYRGLGKINVFSKRHLTPIDDTINIYLPIRHYKTKDIVKSNTVSIPQSRFDARDLYFQFDYSYVNDDGVEVSRPMVSPFIYIYDQHIRKYNGYLFNEKIDVLVNTIQIHNLNLLPPIWKLICYYDYNRKKSFIKIESINTNQDISNYVFVISTDIGNYTLSQNNFFKTQIQAQYLTEYGTILSEFKAHIAVSCDGLKVYDLRSSAYIQQMQFIEQLQLKVKNKKVGELLGGTGFVLDIPIIDQAYFDSNREKVLEQLKQMMLLANIDKNRQIGHEPQIRFFNTIFMPKYFRAGVKAVDGIVSCQNYLEGETRPCYFTKISTINQQFNGEFPIKVKCKIKFNDNNIKLDRVDAQSLLQEIKLFIAEYLNDFEGSDSVKYYESNLADALFAKYSTYIIHIEIISPLTFEIRSFYEILRGVLEIEDGRWLLTTFTPPYIYHDINNIDIEILK